MPLQRQGSQLGVDTTRGSDSVPKHEGLVGGVLVQLIPDFGPEPTTARRTSELIILRQLKSVETYSCPIASSSASVGLIFMPASMALEATSPLPDLVHSGPTLACTSGDKSVSDWKIDCESVAPPTWVAAKVLVVRVGLVVCEGGSAEQSQSRINARGEPYKRRSNLPRT